MRRAFLFATALGVASVPVHAQDTKPPGLGEVLVTANRQNAPYAWQDRPVVGLRRQADSAVVQVSFSSDARDAEVRKREIHAMLAAALDRAAGAGVELVTGGFDLTPVTKTGYQSLPLFSAGRVDTSQATLLVKVRLAGSTAAAGQRIDAFVKAIPRTGRGAVDRTGSLTLTIVDPDQYRDAIAKAVADDARRHAALFGSDYAVQVTGIDGQVVWSQVSPTEVFLHLPYRYTIVPK
ncbi:SIMPL domain-containing protein [Glacieibacterium frigidum]|uniref:TonB-dependent receptor n=1 Tax=Glacieibacterium frigidum TaxID=2593303 RepID=A0A552UAF8_9SPHN|nr:SIMPL domain-containing protein [Glacieibacterium frigidum]TRW15179.1 TonB-dependent receptor [Glacieibacterium frigidum]